MVGDIDAVATTGRDLKVVVIGAGMSGILSAIKLREAGYTDITLYERADRLGGTWRDNTYPGLTCDVPSHLYRYTFAPNPDWAQRFSSGSEIQRYFEGVADAHDIVPLIRFNSAVTAAHWSKDRWRLTVQGGGEDWADIIIAATGVLRDPAYPSIEGLDDFAGAAFHSARWDHRVGLEGKRVGIIGTGSTAIQIAPAIIDTVRKLSLFQRTAQWILPIANPPITEPEREQFRREPAQMTALYDELTRRWQDTFARAVVGDTAEMKKIADACLANLEENVHDPDLRERLRPDYKVACKRLIMSDAFYPAIQQPNAELVTAAIEGVEPAGVRTRDGRLHELDVLVLATGFQAHNFMRPMILVGEGGLTLDEAWADAAEAHRAVAVPGFPNFFMLAGPNSPIGNFSLIMISELQLDYVMQLMEEVRQGHCRSIAPRPAATARFNAEIKAAMPNTVWVTGCKSWYLDKNGNPAMWPWPFEKFRADMARPDLSEYSRVG